MWRYIFTLVILMFSPTLDQLEDKLLNTVPPCGGAQSVPNVIYGTAVKRIIHLGVFTGSSEADKYFFLCSIYHA